MSDLFIESLASEAELVERLSHDYYLARAKAAHELVNRKSREALPRLLALAGDESWFVRYEAARAAARLEPPREQAIALLRRLLGDEDELVRLEAAWGLRRLGETEGLPPVDDGPPELVVHGAVPELRGHVCQEFILQEFWFGGGLCDEVGSIWMRFSGRWYELRFDCIVYWEERDAGPTKGRWSEASPGEHRLVDLAERLQFRGDVLERLTAEATPTGAVVSFSFAGGLELTFEDRLDETSYRFTRRAGQGHSGGADHPKEEP